MLSIHVLIINKHIKKYVDFILKSDLLDGADNFVCVLNSSEFFCKYTKKANKTLMITSNAKQILNNVNNFNMKYNDLKNIDMM